MVSFKTCETQLKLEHKKLLAWYFGLSLCICRCCTSIAGRLVSVRLELSPWRPRAYRSAPGGRARVCRSLSLAQCGPWERSPSLNPARRASSGPPGNHSSSMFVALSLSDIGPRTAPRVSACLCVCVCVCCFECHVRVICAAQSLRSRPLAGATRWCAVPSCYIMLTPGLVADGGR